MSDITEGQSLLSETVVNSNEVTSNTAIPIPEGYVDDESGKMSTIEVFFFV